MLFWSRDSSLWFGPITNKVSHENGICLNSKRFTSGRHSSVLGLRRWYVYVLVCLSRCDRFTYDTVGHGGWSVVAFHTPLLLVDSTTGKEPDNTKQNAPCGKFLYTGEDIYCKIRPTNSREKNLFKRGVAKENLPSTNDLLCHEGTEVNMYICVIVCVCVHVLNVKFGAC